MHSATKAGTLGAITAVAAAAGAGGSHTLPVAAATIVALLVTIPAAAQILGRALYTSGALLRLGRPDPLAGKLPRAAGPAAERAARGTAEPPDAS
jgi:multicomponent Na+:H+ antiporter subunit G